MEKIKLTEKEEKLMKYWLEGGSDWNCDKIDITKSWQENHFEGDDWADIVYLERYNKLLGTNNAGSRAILGSLQQKGLISLTYDDGGENAVTWIFVGEKEFNNIKLAFGEEEKKDVVEENKIEQIKAEMKLSEEAIKKEQEKIKLLKMKMLKQELLAFQRDLEKEQNPNRDTIVFGEYQIMKEIVELWQSK